MNIRATGIAVAALLALGVCHWIAQIDEDFKFWGTMIGITALALIVFLGGIAALIAPYLDRHPHIPPWSPDAQDAQDAQDRREPALRTVHTGAQR